MKEIKPYEKNAKIHTDKQLELLAKIVAEIGWRQSVEVNQEGVIVVGHGRYLAWQKFKDKYNLPDVWVIDDTGKTIMGKHDERPLTEQQERMWRLADNQVNAMTGIDMSLAVPELKLLDDDMLDLSGFDKDLIIEPEDKDDEVPEVPEEPKSKLGDLYELGNHRVLCGDSTKVEDVEKLMNNRYGKVLFTSPPYNMNAGMYENYEDNLKKEEYIQFNLDVINLFKNRLRGFLFWNISYNKNSRDDFIEIIYNIIKKTGLKFLELIVWNKKHGIPITSKEMMTRQYEDIFLFADDESIKEDIELFFCGRNDKTAFFNKKTNKGITNYWEIGTNNTQLENHLACFPVALPTKGILLMSNENDIVIDPFLGSGSTLIASEKTNRVCYGMELDCRYVDTTVQRYVDYTGNNKIKLNGKEITWK